MAQESGIVWLASYPKSGNTWTRSFLNNLYAVMEYGLDVETQDINKMQRLTAWDIGVKQYELILGKPLSEATEAEIDRARPKLQEQIVQHNSGLLLVKTHNALAMVNGAPTINMGVTAGGVYIVRNPLDVAISFSHHMGISIDDTIRVMATPHYRPQNSEKSIGEYYGSWNDNVASWTRKKNPALLTLRYEDMHADPVAAFGALARHLRQPASPAELQRAIELSSFGNLQKMEQTEGFKEKPKNMKRFFRSGRTGEWRDVLTDKQVIKITTLNEPMMDAFVYLDDV